MTTKEIRFLKRIIKKLQADGNKHLFFIEHIDGDTQNNNLHNLRYAHFKEWLAEPSRQVDWVLYLNKKERDFVVNNRENLLKVIPDVSIDNVNKTMKVTHHCQELKSLFV